VTGDVRSLIIVLLVLIAMTTQHQVLEYPPQMLLHNLVVEEQIQNLLLLQFLVIL